MNINVSILVGRLADDVIYYPAKNGVSSRIVGKLTVNRPPNNSGDRKNDTIQIVAWGNHAENIAEHTAKGKELAIIGEQRVNNKRPEKKGDTWKNYSEVLVRFVSFGRDSTQQKMMKAIASGVGLEMINSFMGGEEGSKMSELAERVKNDPKMQQRVAAIAKQRKPEEEMSEAEAAFEQSIVEAERGFSDDDPFKEA